MYWSSCDNCLQLLPIGYCCYLLLLPLPLRLVFGSKGQLFCSEALGSLDMLVVGLGGGAIPTFVHERCAAKGANVKIESIELSSTVASLAQRFFGYTAQSGSVDLTDGLAGLRSREGRHFDLVVVDCFGDGDEVPASCRSPEFVQRASALLAADGVVVQNTWARSSAAKQGVRDRCRERMEKGKEALSRCSTG